MVRLAISTASSPILCLGFTRFYEGTEDSGLVSISILDGLSMGKWISDFGEVGSWNALAGKERVDGDNQVVADVRR